MYPAKRHPLTRGEKNKQKSIPLAAIDHGAVIPPTIQVPPHPAGEKWNGGKRNQVEKEKK